MKKVLVVGYSQSGQLHEVIARFIEPLHGTPHVKVRKEILRPQHPFPFPWSFPAFLDVFPESVRLEPRPLQPLSVGPEENFDLIILAYQVWFLSPSQPITAFLQSAEGKRLLNGKPVITVIACRNMWLSAQETTKRLIAEAGGRLCDNVVLTDRAHPLATFITTPRWLLTGRRDSFFGLPPAGVNPAVINDCARFGAALIPALAEDREKTGQPLLDGLRAVTVEARLIMSERAGQRAFRVWSWIVSRFGAAGQKRRQPALFAFALYLIALIVTVVPLSLLLQTLLRPLLASRLARLKAYYEQPSGSQDYRLN